MGTKNGNYIRVLLFGAHGSLEKPLNGINGHLSLFGIPKDSFKRIG